MKIAFSFIGGAHQFLHGAPVAAVLSRMPGVTVDAYVCTPADKDALQQLLSALAGDAVNVIDMALPRWLPRNHAPLKVLRLIYWANRLRGADCIVALERTSALLARLPGDCPPMVQIPHGAGDRAKGYDRRLRFFDRVLVAGEKDRERMVAMGLLTPEQVRAVGYIKMAGLRRLHGLERPRLFGNDRPTVLYNPHFDAKLSSWHSMGEEIIRRLADDERFNLIVAPHVRLLETASAAERERWERLARPGKVMIDLGSPRSMDMTYTLAADLYLGDVSSQVYEFCSIPRPCVFVNAHGARWQNDPFYAMWHLGIVIDDAAQLSDAILNGFAAPDAFAAAQRKAVRWSFGDPDVPADEAAASAIIEFLAGTAPAIRQPNGR